MSLLCILPWGTILENLFLLFCRAIKSPRRMQKRQYRNRKTISLKSEHLEPRQCLAGDGIPGGVYEAGNLNQADIAMLADVARARYGVDGAGIKIGIISDSFNNLGGAEYDVAHGALPEIVHVLHEGSGTAEDEGRAMAQLVHAIAPGAELFFSAYADEGESQDPYDQLVTMPNQFAARIGELVDAGCTIIVDDIYNPVEPWFQDGPVSRAVDDAVRRGTTYFTAASNHSNFSYESTFHAVTPPVELLNLEDFAGRALQFHDFDPGDAIEVLQRITLSNYEYLKEKFFVSQWDQPWGQNNSTVEVWFFDQNKIPIGKANTLPEYPAALRAIGENLTLEGGTLPALGSEFYVAFAHVLDGTEPPGFFKWIIPSNGLLTLNGTNSYGSVEFTSSGASTAWGHSNSALGASVGAAPYWETPAYGQATPQLTSFSSWGGTPIFFDASGTRLDSPLHREQPRFVAPQEGDTTFFGQRDTERDGLLNFQGTSAAAPNAAAVAALMLQLDPSLTPAEIYRILASTAVPMPSPSYTPQGVSESYNFATGAGMIQAEQALAAVAGLTIRGTVFEDFDRNGVQSGNELPLPGVTVFLDSNGNGVRDSAPAPESALPFVRFESVAAAPVGEAERVANPNRNQAPELVWPAKAYGRIDVVEMPGTVTDLEVSFTLRADSATDPQTFIFVTLVNPAGVRVPLAGTRLTGGTFQDYVDSGVKTYLIGTNPLTATLSFGSSLVNLAAFFDMPANGAWSLGVMNPDSSRTYTLETWSLSLRTAEQSTTTENDGSYDFPSQMLSLASGVGSFLPTIELPDNRRLTSGLGARPVELRVGDDLTENFAVSLPAVQRPLLLPTAVVRLDGSIPGPHPVAFTWADLATAFLPERVGLRFVVSSVHGRVEKRVGSDWIDVTLPSSSSPRELLAMLHLRTIQPGDDLRWIPREQAQQDGPAFAIIGWDGLATTLAASTVEFGAETVLGSGV